MSLEPNQQDRLAAVGRGVLGAAPFIGPILSELISAVIPNQRLERLVGFAQALDERLEGLDREQVRARLAQPGFADLMEDGLHQAARALTDERIGRIATLVKNGIMDEVARDAEWKRLLWLLGEVTDFEVLILLSRSYRKQNDDEFLQIHAESLHPRSVHMKSSKEDRDEAAFFQSNYDRLVSLGLLRRQYRAPRRGEMPELDEETGALRQTGLPKLTRLGARLLAAIDLMSDEDIELK